MGPLIRPPFARGFTLVEILVVVAILAIAAGVASVSLAPDERGDVAREARRFAGALEYAAARAQMRGETLGVSAEGSTWRFWMRDGTGSRWLPLAGDDALAARALREPMQVAPLSYAGRAIPRDSIVPLRPSGRNDPFAFALTSPHYAATLSADPLNRVRVAGPAPIE